ncbi:efflux RND transporter periplasmic adaptor subunit [Acidobacteriota bacterium]
MRKITKAKTFVALFLFLSFFSCKPQDSNEATQEESFGAAPVKVFNVKKQRISEKISYTGTIEAWEKIKITPDVGGRIARIHVEEGQQVRKGQLLAEMDTKPIRLQLEQAIAGLAAAEANFKDAKVNMERMERLVKEKAVSDQQYEKVKLVYDAAGAQLQQVQAALNLAQYALDVSLMKAPFKGIIASKLAEVGDVINPMMGGGGILMLMDFSRVKIEIEVTHSDIERIKKGQAAFLRVMALVDQLFQGSIFLVNQTADPLTKKFKVAVKVDNPDLVLRPNTFGEVTIEVNTREDALVIPQKAMLEQRYVFVARDNKFAERREVTLGLQNTEMVEILSGLNEGDLVIVEGNYGLEDNVEIEIKED